MKVIGIIPARLESNRFPNKLLQTIDGIRIIDRVIINAQKFNFIDKLILATDSKELINICNNYSDIEIFDMTGINVSCGSERVKYVYGKYPDYDYYVSIPSDEPMIDFIEVNRAFTEYDKDKESIITFYSDFFQYERISMSNTCKIVSSGNNVLYFSRGVVPFSKNGKLDNSFYKKHIGIFIIPKNILSKYFPWEKTELATLESLEQNMFIENGINVKLLKIKHKYHGIDSPDDIDNIENLLGVKK